MLIYGELKPLESLAWLLDFHVVFLGGRFVQNTGTPIASASRASEQRWCGGMMGCSTIFLDEAGDEAL